MEYLLDRESWLPYPLICIVLILLRFFFGHHIFGHLFPFWGQLVFRHMSKRFILSGFLMLLAGSLASCGFGSSSSPASNTAQNNAPAAQGATDAPAPTAQTQSGALTIPPPVAQPPSYNDRPGNEASNATTMPNGLPALQPKGVNVNGLFAEQLSDNNARFSRLENAVTDLRREFESFKPAITRLVAVESDIQDLIKQLDMLLQNEPPPAPMPAVQPMVPNAPPQQLTPQDTAPPPAPAPAQSTNTSGGSNVSALRVGQHSDRLRVVMDLSSKASLMADLDNAENLLILELPDASWSAATQKSFAKSPLIRSYTVESINNGRGSRVIMALKKNTQILKQQDLPPGNNPNYRVYIDLAT